MIRLQNLSTGLTESISAKDFFGAIENALPDKDVIRIGTKQYRLSTFVSYPAWKKHALPFGFFQSLVDDYTLNGYARQDNYAPKIIDTIPESAIITGIKIKHSQQFKVSIPAAWIVPGVAANHLLITDKDYTGEFRAGMTGVFDAKNFTVVSSELSGANTKILVTWDAAAPLANTVSNILIVPYVSLDVFDENNDYYTSSFEPDPAAPYAPQQYTYDLSAPVSQTTGFAYPNINLVSSSVMSKLPAGCKMCVALNMREIPISSIIEGSVDVWVKTEFTD